MKAAARNDRTIRGKKDRMPNPPPVSRCMKWNGMKVAMLNRTILTTAFIIVVPPAAITCSEYGNTV